MDKRKPRAKAQRITCKKASAPKAARKGPLAEEAILEIAASPPPLPVEGPAVQAEVPEPPAAPAPVIEVVQIEARVPASEDEPTTRVVFRARAFVEMRPHGWQLLRAFLRRMRSELETRSAPARAQIARRFPRLAGLGRILARVGL